MQQLHEVTTTIPGLLPSEVYEEVSDKEVNSLAKDRNLIPFLNLYTRPEKWFGFPVLDLEDIDTISMLRDLQKATLQQACIALKASEKTILAAFFQLQNGQRERKSLDIIREWPPTFGTLPFIRTAPSLVFHPWMA